MGEFFAAIGVMTGILLCGLLVGVVIGKIVFRDRK